MAHQAHVGFLLAQATHRHCIANKVFRARAPFRQYPRGLAKSHPVTVGQIGFILVFQYVAVFGTAHMSRQLGPISGSVNCHCGFVRVIEATIRNRNPSNRTSCVNPWRGRQKSAKDRRGPCTSPFGKNNVVIKGITCPAIDYFHPVHRPALAHIVNRSPFFIAVYNQPTLRM